MKRREFISVLGGAATWPLAARAQQSSPVIGFLSVYSRNGFGRYALTAFHQGLKEAGYIEGQNVAVEYRWAEGQYDRVPALADDLVRRRVNVIVASGSSALRQMTKTITTVPIVFSIGGDPVGPGLVASLSRPGGNITGAVTLSQELAPKRLELMHQLVPRAAIIAVLLSPTAPGSDNLVRSLEAGASALGRRLQVLHADSDREIERAFETLRQLRPGGLVMGTGATFTDRSELLAALALRQALPAIHQFRPFAAAGGLMSYGADIGESYRHVGRYAGRIIAGAKPADLPIQQSTKVELIINLRTVRALGLDMPESVLARADEVIE